MESSCTSCCTSTCAFSCLYRTVCPSQLIRCHRRRPRDAVFISECNVSVCPLLCHNSKCVFRDNFITSVLLFFTVVVALVVVVDSLRRHISRRHVFNLQGCCFIPQISVSELCCPETVLRGPPPLVGDMIDFFLPEPV